MAKGAIGVVGSNVWVEFNGSCILFDRIVESFLCSSNVRFLLFFFLRIKYVRPKRTLASALIWSALSLFSSEVIGREGGRWGSKEGQLRSGSEKEKEAERCVYQRAMDQRSELRVDEIIHSDTLTHSLIHPQSLSSSYCSAFFIDDYERYHLRIYITNQNMSTKKVNWGYT